MWRILYYVEIKERKTAVTLAYKQMMIRLKKEAIHIITNSSEYSDTLLELSWRFLKGAKNGSYNNRF